MDPINSDFDCAKGMKSQTNFNQVTMSCIVIAIQRYLKPSKQALNGTHTPILQFADMRVAPDWMP